MSNERDKLEAVRRRMEKVMANATIRSYITPFPVSNFIQLLPEDGVVLRYMFPARGEIPSACIYLTGDVKKRVNASAYVANINGYGTGVNIVVNRNFMKFNMGTYVDVGDRLEVKLEAETPITDIWVAFLWIPSVGDTEMKKFLLSELSQLDSGEQNEGV